MKDIAIIGFSGIFPDANSVNDFAENLLKGKCSINEISKKRLFNTSISDEIDYYKAGYLEEITFFDYKFFNISLGEAEEMSPHQRLLLQEAYKTFENAGYRLKDLKGSDTSVYVANAKTNYFLLAEESTPTLIAGNINAMLASRVSRFFDLRGAAINVDTTCSSSLTAITLACKDIILEETGLALVCGVNINVVPTLKDTEILLGVEAKNESCNPFSENAEGTMGGETVTCVLLKSLEQAEADGDVIYGVIKGFGLNQDGGQSASIMAPSSDGQANVINKALKKAGLVPKDITLIEAHGTGTKLGDPIEVEGISQVFSPSLEYNEKVYVSAVKSNIGHTDSAAGIVGVIKVLLSFKNNIIYPSINALPLNSFIDFEKAKVSVVTKPISWNDVKRANKKRAGVSSFGLMGTNAHLILESYEKENSSVLETVYDQYVLCFSAKSKTSLSKYLMSFKNYLSDTEDSLHNISFTLNTCRELYQYRYLVTAKSKKHLLEILNDTTSDQIVDSSIEDFNENISIFDDQIAISDEILEAIPYYSSYRTLLLSDAQKSLFVQYFSYQSLLKSGVCIKEMIGIGIGKILFKVLKNEISFDEALKSIDSVLPDTKNSNEELEARAKKLVNKYSNGLKIIVIGYEGKLANVFKRLTNNNLYYNAIGYGLSLNNNLVTLLNFNSNVDPSDYYQKGNFCKVELPSYCFEEKRCWIRTTDNPYNPKVVRSEKNISLVNYEGFSIVEQLEKMWSEILKTEMQKDDDFFDFGGHSLNGLQLINKINKHFSLDLNIDILFENGSPHEMADFIELKIKNNNSLPVKQEEIKKVQPQDLYDVSFAQKRLWLQAKMSDNASSLNVAMSIIIEGELDYFNLNKAYEILIQRHESLRTSFVLAADELKQKIYPFDDITETGIKYEIKENLSEEALNAYILNLVEFPFDLDDNGLLTRATLVKIHEDKYIFNITLHHLICDGWSLTIFQKEFFHIYNALCSKEEFLFEPLEIHYKDYTSWQLEKSKDISFKESESFWLSQFIEKTQDLSLQFQKGRPNVKTYNGDINAFIIPEALTNSIKELVKKEGITLAMFFGTILNSFVSLLSGETDITLGLPITNRNLTQLENQIGLYLNTLAVRSRLDVKASFKDLLKETSNNFKLAYKHQDYPFELLVEKLHLQKNYSRSPLFDIAFTVQNYLNINILDELKSYNDNLNFQNFELNNYSSAQFDLLFRFIDLETELFYELEYNTDLFAKETIVKYHHFILNIMQQCVDNNELKMEEISLISKNEIEQIKATIFGFNNTKVDYPVNKTVIDLFEEQVEKTPNNVAVIFEGTQLTYQELNEQSNQLAHYLKENYAIEPNDFIGIKLNRSERMVISILGILKSGGAYVPLDVNFPQERIDFITIDASLKVCIDENEFEKFRSVKESYDKTSLQLSNLVDSLAYCMYTSGSTGNPKGVLIHHAALYNRLLWMQLYLNVGEKEVFLQKTPYTFDISVWELILPFLTGSSLVIARPEGHKDVDYLQEIINEKKVSIVHFVPSMLGAFLLDVDAEKCSSIEHIISGGEELPAIMAHDCKEKFKRAQLHNFYGPTEATIEVTAINLTEINVLEQGVSIGKPIANTSIYIVNNSLELLPVGVPGELLISGIQVARGYLNLPELTKDRFIADPFRENHMVYRTGDIAEWLPDGSIRYMGRVDNQVKIRGNRIELGEIENAIMLYGDIQQSVTLVKELNNEKALVAYYLPEKGKTISKSELRTYLQGKLPEYMVPGFYVLLDAIPKTSSGKVDRKALPGVEGEDLIRGEYVLPKNKKEEELVAIWQEVLGIEKVGVTDNFFELGGHSLSVAQVVNRIHKQFGKTITIKLFFANPTIEGLSKGLQDSEYIAIPKAPESESYPLTASQRRLWIMSQLEGGSLAYNMPGAVTLKGV
ncbi:non-ribosomal peptide synthetase, partial [Flavobacterium nitrogenifigens]